jgi:hypothetical protein
MCRTLLSRQRKSAASCVSQQREFHRGSLQSAVSLSSIYSGATGFLIGGHVCCVGVATPATSAGASSQVPHARLSSNWPHHGGACLLRCCCNSCCICPCILHPQVLTRDSSATGLIMEGHVLRYCCNSCCVCPCMLHHRYLTRDSSGRLLIPTESSDGRRSDAWKAFVVVACVCPPSLWERVEKAAARKVSARVVNQLHWMMQSTWVYCLVAAQHP